jgi:hypothetical protein
MMMMRGLKSTIARITGKKNQAACFADGTTFIRCQSYGNSLPQSRQTIYVIVGGFPSDEGVPCFLAVMGKVQWW